MEWNDDPTGLLAEHRAYLQDEDARGAFDVLVQEARQLQQYECEPRWHGAMRVFRYSDRFAEMSPAASTARLGPPRTSDELNWHLPGAPVRRTGWQPRRGDLPHAVLSAIAVGGATMESLQRVVDATVAINGRRDDTHTALGLLRWAASKKGISFTCIDGVVSAEPLQLEPAVPFEFIINRRDLRFYIRKAGRYRVGDHSALRSHFDRVEEIDGELTVNVSSREAAAKLHELVFHRATHHPVRSGALADAQPRPSAYLLTWDPDEFEWPDDILSARIGERSRFAWTWTSETLHGRKGDRVFLVRAASHGGGVFASGRLHRDSRQQSVFARSVDVTWDLFLDPREPARLLDISSIEGFPALDAGEVALSPDVAARLAAAWLHHVAKNESEPVSDAFGRPYAPVGLVPKSAEREPFPVDPAVIDRGNQGHATTQDALAAFLSSIGLEPVSPVGEPNFDLGWRNGTQLFVAEVKSITAANEEHQLRLGLGQLLRYRHSLAARGHDVVAVLVPERAPRDPSWLSLCEALDVVLVWPGAFEQLTRREGEEQ